VSPTELSFTGRSSDRRPFGQTDMKTVGLNWKCRASASTCLRFISRFPARISEIVDSAIPVSVATSVCLVARLSLEKSQQLDARNRWHCVMLFFVFFHQLPQEIEVILLLARYGGINQSVVCDLLTLVNTASAVPLTASRNQRYHDS
jgi:hypothetical protein